MSSRGANRALERAHRVAALALFAVSACTLDVSLGSRDPAGMIDGGGGDACICESPQTNECGNCPAPSVCDPAAGILCPCTDPTDCPAGYSCLPSANAALASCTPPASCSDPDSNCPDAGCPAGTPNCNATGAAIPSG